jgi:hypothetical protein
MSGVLQILGIGPRIADADGRDFDPHLVNCQENVSHLVERLAQPAATRNWSLCLYGSSGTGKSQFARYIANRLGLEVMQQRASDLLSMYLGESEKQIAAAFATARAQRSMLVIDEADCRRWPNVGSPRFRRDPFVRDGVFDLGRASAPRITVPHMLPSATLKASASAILLLSRLNRPPCTIAVYASPWSSPPTTQHSLPGGRYPLPGPDIHRLDLASFLAH